MTKNDMASVSKNDGGAAKTRLDGESTDLARQLEEIRDRWTMAQPDKPDTPWAVLSRAAEALTSLRTERDEARARQHEVPDEVHLKVSQALADLAAAEARALKAEAENKALKEQLQSATIGLNCAVERFREYAELHAAKGTEDGDEKARRNADMAYSLSCCLPPSESQ